MLIPFEWVNSLPEFDPELPNVENAGTKYKIFDKKANVNQGKFKKWKLILHFTLFFNENIVSLLLRKDILDYILFVDLISIISEKKH